MDAVLYVHGGPTTRSADDLLALLTDVIQRSLIPPPICFRLEGAPSTGRWAERWRLTVAFADQAAAIAAVAPLRGLSIVFDAEQIPLQVTSLAYISSLYGVLGWLTNNIRASHGGDIAVASTHTRR
jgi:hypothetical protein